MRVIHEQINIAQQFSFIPVWIAQTALDYSSGAFLNLENTIIALSICC